MTHRHDPQSATTGAVNGITCIASICALVMSFCALCQQPTTGECWREARTALAVGRDAAQTAEQARDDVKKLRAEIHQQASPEDFPVLDGVLNDHEKRLKAVEPAIKNLRERVEAAEGDFGNYVAEQHRFADEFRQARQFVDNEAEAINEKLSTFDQRQKKQARQLAADEALAKNVRENVVYIRKQLQRPRCGK